MCDIHGKKLEYFCIQHETYCCRKCKAQTHDQHPCECMHVRDVYDRLHHEMEEHIQDVIRLRDRSQRILDGSYQRSLLYRVSDEETHLDKFYKDMKKKFKETKLKIKAFTSEDLSEESRGQLHGFIGKSVPQKFGKNDRPVDMMRQMKQVNKQVKLANMLLYSLPNYIEVEVDSKFMNLLTYSGDPINIRGRPKYMTQVSSDEEEFAFSDDGIETNHQLNEEDFEVNENTAKLIKKTFKSKQAMTSSKSAPAREYVDGLDDDDDVAQTGVLKWQNNIPAFKPVSTSTSGGKPPGLAESEKLGKRENKYEKEIAAAKQRLKFPPISRTPEPIKNIRRQFENRKSVRSMPEKETIKENVVQKLFLKNTKFKVKKRFKLDGCEDALVLKDCILLSLGEKVQKRDQTTLQLGVEMKLAQCSSMCAISGSATQVAVLQLRKCITVIDTQFGLLVVYKIKIHQDYIDICHVGNSDEGPQHPSYLFAAVYKGIAKQPLNCLDIVQAKATHRPGRPPTFDAFAEEITIQGEKPKVILGIGGFIDGHIILGCGDAVMCINHTGKIVWRTPAPFDVTGILCTKNLIYVCLQDKKRVVIFNKAGFVTEENVVPDLEIIPCRLSANWQTMLIKDFKTKTWTTVVFKHGIFIV
ncbi:hypothetical protein DPMN_102107 [Dreissena polymorpha]|uniref:B box-type domain-containing protein n=1 Tax=Dreissena polymorpha TaxID=45954 RepID=A0A9D4LIN0_DREPO|nr:hypothetical protein DPMN_102107 [Dreissena polymorpha]